MNKLIMFLYFIGVVYCFCSCNKEIIPQKNIDSELRIPDNISKIDYDVYNSLFDTLYRNNNQIFFLQKTDNKIYWNPKTIISKYFSLDTTAIIAYEKVNNNTSFLNYQLLTKVITLVPYEEPYDSLRSKFYHKYPDAKGLNAFSRIGFNRDSTQAIFGISYHGKSFEASDITYLFEKKESRWILKWFGGVHTN